jgi:hypothetical protein
MKPSKHLLLKEPPFGQGSLLQCMVNPSLSGQCWHREETGLACKTAMGDINEEKLKQNASEDTASMLGPRSIVIGVKKESSEGVIRCLCTYADLSAFTGPVCMSRCEHMHLFIPRSQCLGIMVPASPSPSNASTLKPSLLDC